MAKGKNYSSAEDEFLARAWKNTSEDSIVGTDQKSSAFWKRVQADYNDLVQGTSFAARTDIGVKNRFRNTISPLCMKFHAIYKRARSENPSGETDFEKIALGVYKKDFGCEFQMVSAWNVLKSSPKWAGGNGVNSH
jgi:hypothetical protein